VYILLKATLLTHATLDHANTRQMATQLHWSYSLYRNSDVDNQIVRNVTQLQVLI